MSSERPMCSGAPGCGQRHPEDFDCGMKWAPEHKKLKAIKAKSHVIGEFLDWLQYTKKWAVCEQHKHSDACYMNPEDRYYSCERDQDEFCLAHISTPKLLAEFFGIDPIKIEAEKELMLDHVRRKNAESEGLEAGDV